MKDREQFYRRLMQICDEMRSIAGKFQPGEPIPPLFCYALNDSLLDDKTYSYLREYGFDQLAGGLPKYGYAVLLYLVRAFYENCDGKDWRKAASNGGTVSQRDVNIIQDLISRKDMPWRRTKGKKEVGVWLKMQCPILKAENSGEKSVVIDVNTALLKLLVARNVNLLSNGRDWVKLACMGPDEIEELKRDINLQTDRLETDFADSLRKIDNDLGKNSGYALDLWVYSRFEWMLALEAMGSSRADVPERIYGIWPWLKPIVDLPSPERNKKTVLSAHWLLYRDGRSHRLYLSLAKDDRASGRKLRIRQGRAEIELDMPDCDLGYEAADLQRRGISLFGSEEITLELLTDGQEHPRCALPTIASCGGCMVFRNLYPKLATAELPMIAPNTLVRTPNLKLVVLHRGRQNPPQSLALYREGEDQAIATVPLEYSQRLAGCDVWCSVLEIQDFKTQSPLYKARIHYVSLKGSKAKLFYALWMPDIELHPAPNADLWVKDHAGVKVIEENRGKGMDVVYLKADGVDSINLPEGVERLSVEPPGEIFEPEEGCCLASVRLQPMKLLTLSVNQPSGEAKILGPFRRNIAETTVLYLPQNWRECAASLPDDEARWQAAKQLEEQLIVPEGGSGDPLCICSPLQSMVWRWVRGDGPGRVTGGLNTPQKTDAAWGAWRLELAKPRGAKIYLQTVSSEKPREISPYCLSRAADGGVEAEELLKPVVSGFRPTQEFEIFISTSPDGSDRELLLSGPVRRSKEFFFVKSSDGSVHLQLCMLPEDREFCTLHILHESDMFHQEGLSNARKKPCADLRWSEDHCCDMNCLFADSRLRPGFYMLRIEDSRTLSGALPFPLSLDEQAVAWYEKGGVNLGLPEADAQKIGASKTVGRHRKIFDRMRDGKYDGAPEVSDLVAVLQSPESDPRELTPWNPFNPLFSGSSILQKLREDAKNYKPTYM